MAAVPGDRRADLGHFDTLEVRTSGDDGHTLVPESGSDQGKQRDQPQGVVLLREPVTRDYAAGSGTSKS